MVTTFVVSRDFYSGVYIVFRISHEAFVWTLTMSTLSDVEPQGTFIDVSMSGKTKVGYLVLKYVNSLNQ